MGDPTRGDGRGQRKRPASGWASLTPTERDVVRLVSEGLANKMRVRMPQLYVFSPMFCGSWWRHAG
jgi:hypothetical protein